jgi:DNA-binding protein Fis
VARGPVLSVHDLRFEQDNGRTAGDRHSVLDKALETVEAQAAMLVQAARKGEARDGVHGLAIERLEQALIRAALDATGGNQVAAARLLGISRSTLRSKLSE